MARQKQGTGEEGIDAGAARSGRAVNVLDIKVPPQLRVKCPTATDKDSAALKWFDDALGGRGMTPSSVMMLTGAPGGGKSTMMLQVADALTGAKHYFDQEQDEEGIWRAKKVVLCDSNRHQVLYNSGEESVHQVAMVVERLGLKNGFHISNHTMSHELFADRDRIAAEHPNSRIFVLQDSLQTLNDGKYGDAGTNGSSPVRACKQLTEHAKRSYDIVVFVGQVNKGGEFSGSNKIKHDTDIHGHIYFDKDRKSDSFGERLFTAQKNRFGCSGRTYMLGMDDRGLYEKGRFELEATDRK
jgi:DNA repair protein RadA/Sms